MVKRFMRPRTSTAAPGFRGGRARPPGAGGTACDRGRPCSRPVPRSRGAPDGTAPRSARGSSRARCRRRGTPSATRLPRQSDGSVDTLPNGMRAVARSTSPANPRTRRQSIGTSNARRAPSKYSSSWRRTASVALGRLEDARGDAIGELVELRRDPLAGIREPHQAARRDDDGERAERRVVGAVGDVEEPVVRRAASERCPQPIEVECRAGARAIGEAALEVVGHGVTSRRSRLQAGAHVLPGGLLADAHPRPDLGVGEVEHEPMHDRVALLGRQAAHRVPDPVVDRFGCGWRGGVDAVEVARRPARDATDGIGRLAPGDGVQPGPKVVAVAQSWIGAQR